jgi:hypothetical protein
MAEKGITSIKASKPEEVDEFISKLNHPRKVVVEALRKIILNAHKEIGEEIFWNAPSFFYSGKMTPFKPKEYKRHILTFNLYKQNCIRLIFLTGAKINDLSGLLEGDYADGRRLALFYSMQDVKLKQLDLQKAIRQWLKLLDK